MILQPCNNVELTKVYYYDQNKRDQNVSVSTISREMYQNSFNKNVVIKKNIFGHKWVLQINDVQNNSKKKQTSKTKKCCKCLLYFFMVFFMVAFLGLGVFYTLDNYFWQDSMKFQTDLNITIPALYPNIIKNVTEDNITSTLLRRKYRTHEKQVDIFVVPEDEFITETTDASLTISEVASPNYEFCQNCTLHVCLKVVNAEKPKCVEILDPNDPTGCGGLCKINTEYCKVLDRESKVFQCLKMENNTLKCEDSEFSCGNRCISLKKRCDGWIDCTNKSDEIECECNLQTHFQCGNSTSCIEKSKMCDGVVHCWDQSDEINCQRAPKCPKNHVQCLNGQCIPKEQFCDKKMDCEDRSDEPKWCQ